MEYKRFENIEVWQFAKELAIEIYKMTYKMDFRKDYALIDQMRRSALSISSNIAEGYERNSKRELAQFLNIAKGSVGELRSQLIIASELGRISRLDYEKFAAICESISKQLKGFIKFLEKNR